MNRIKTKVDAFVAASAALDIIRSIQSSGIKFDNEAVDVSLATARSDLEFVCRLFAHPSTPPERCPRHSTEDGSWYCRKCGVPLPCEEKSK